MGLGLKLDAVGNGTELRANEHELELGEAIMITFKLPDGSEKPHQFKMGQSVGFLKAVVESEYGHKIPTQTLLLGDDKLLDPMCLSDYPAIKPATGAVLIVQVSE
mmetsp:Transcript_41550/g.50377  ORF Transcript_41550/g.50377 Transcript_41550/m.50377 type:complete len:105 (+) Transcript_41550:90-404(+)|eukprot:CAMPEP_0197847298 /NCGR_PEP_ID=MMETSP1438-20131217/5694_1 /TAXON_ID=1461541 /ORGANISM="Pterosperma sp., Strain CCMP1384" /LENGTH=104 /DNA_ID=CAMNT_0043459173 /DNA_START=85 /DNA_END=399 /DNA_ORIENTATION=+